MGYTHDRIPAFASPVTPLADRASKIDMNRRALLQLFLDSICKLLLRYPHPPADLGFGLVHNDPVVSSGVFWRGGKVFVGIYILRELVIYICLDCLSSLPLVNSGALQLHMPPQLVDCITAVLLL